MSTNLPIKHWDTHSFLHHNSTRPNALIILNTPLPHRDLFAKLFCADGGANRLYDAYVKPLQEGAEDRFLPDLIRGDLDSLRPDAQEYYISKNVVVQRDPDQDSTDLGKCVAALVEKENESGQKYQLVIVGGLSGRLDQTAHTIHALTRLAEERESTWAVGRESVACVLGTGKHELKVSHEEFGDTCAILPFGQPAHVTTKGQKWDLGPTAYMYPTSFSSGISSSNHLPPGQVLEVETDVAVVFTVEVREK